ncbi:hypothetical protein [Acidipropionibacterium virtanenii]|uniref:Uncharacterized protein n=1 Tax=Acidipropionibacterium virtanenii TaxID=2057246 RepID=A0A344UQI3_9ACTN|nr:hypothetical protein [Acidipropionibacterium virtanenii]AXE37531.1 hypothetical protein JS278_00334 [Acidipropionibacterium virtanenii]
MNSHDVPTDRTTDRSGSIYDLAAALPATRINNRTKKEGRS